MTGSYKGDSEQALDEAAVLLHETNWQDTALGPREDWPTALKTLIDVISGSGQPMFVVWGEARTLIYNDPYAEILANKHPEAFGADFLEVWHEISDELLPIVEKAQNGIPVQSDDIELWMDRKGYTEETHFAFSYTPVRADNGEIAGFFCVCQEITGQIMAERALRASEEEARTNADRLQLALDAGAIIGTWFWDIQADNLTVDEAFAETFGMPPELSREDLRLEQVIGAVHPDDKDSLEAAIEASIAQGGPYAHRYRVKRADERYYWIEANGRVDRDETGAAKTFSGVLLDMEERRKTERALKDVTRRLEAILDNTREAVFLMNEDQHCVYANRSAELLTGYKFEEMRGRPLHDVVHHKKPDGSHYPIEECPIDRAFPTRAQMSGEELFVAPDGSFYPVAFTASPMLNDRGKPVGTVIEARDISDEKAAEAEQRETQERYRLAVKATNDAIWDWDLTTNQVQWNEAIETLFGYSLGDVGSTGDWWIEHIHPDDRARIDQSIHAVIEGSESHWTAEYRFLDANGKPIHVYDRGFVIRNDECEAVRMIGAMLDLTERRRAEDALKELNHELERRVTEEVEERAKAEEALRQAQKMEAVGQLTGGIAHDFNNLLTIVTGNIDMADRALRGSSDPDPRLQRALGNALKGAERAAALTQRLLAFSRRQPLEPKPLDADRLVSGMSDLVQRALGETIKLEVVTSPGLWRAEADPNQLEAAILNLSVNARDAMPQGGTLTIETANARLDEAYSADHAEVAPGQYVVIAVTDTGQGMSKETLTRVFEPFFTTKDVGKGTGLGLSMVYGFTKQSGGHVKIYSEEGHGTTVKLYLPRLVNDITDDIEIARDESVDLSRSQETILVVEDDEDVRSYTVECLHELGYRVLDAHDGPAALRVLESENDRSIDLLFTDVVMPGMTGRELADIVRDLQPEIKVLYTSGYTRDAIVHGGRLDEGVEMISKPFTYQSLARKVADVLEKGRTGRILLVIDDPTLRMFTSEGLVAAGYMLDEAETEGEAMSLVRAARGNYDAVFVDAREPRKAGDKLARTIRSLHVDMPILLAVDDVSTAFEKYENDRCTGVIGKPYNSEKLLNELARLGVRCRSKTTKVSENNDNALKESENE